ncbi:hypothetical protein Tco_1409527 [Tanacetum coccineum]
MKQPGNSDNFLLPFMVQMLEKISEGMISTVFLVVLSRLFPNPIDPRDTKKKTILLAHTERVATSDDLGLCSCSRQFQRGTGQQSNSEDVKTNGLNQFHSHLCANDKAVEDCEDLRPNPSPSSAKFRHCTQQNPLNLLGP